MLEGILIFILFLGPLVFFHELGHFLFARLFGVKVEVFSIGFGPKILSFKKGDTNYALSIIPLGGYVKMFGDDPLSEKELTPEEEAVAYTKKSKWARFWIVFGGPLANFIMAFVIYVCLVTAGEKLPQTKFGKITTESDFHSVGVKTGDILSKVNDQEITSFDDFNLIDTNVESITVNRDGKSVELPYKINGIEFVGKFGQASRPLRAPILMNSKNEQFLVRFKNSKIVSIEEILESSEQEVIVEKYSGTIGFEFHADQVPAVGHDVKVLKKTGSWGDVFAKEGLYPRDLYIKNVLMGSAAAGAGMKKGDLIVGINGESIFDFDILRKNVKSFKPEEKKAIELVVLREGEKQKISLTPQEKEYNGQKSFSIGVESGVSFYSYMVEHKSQSIGDAIVKGFYRTKVGFIKTLQGFKKLITGEVSIKHVGGPIAIGQVATDSFNISLSMFFRLMAIISINLGIINLFPIPVLDGGHIVFIFLELVNGGPLSRKKLMYAQQFGMSLLFLLIFVALFNDISRIF